MGPSSASLLKCPKCGRIDQVQKVSAVVSSGATTGQYTGSGMGFGSTYGRHGSVANTLMFGGATLTGGQETVLSQRLAPPMQPVYEKARIVWDTNSQLALALCIIGGVVGVPVAMIALSTSSLGCLIGLAIFGLSLVAIVSARRAHAKDVRAFYASENPRWQAAIDKWNDLYYCGRDDLVFIPETREMADAEEMMSFLYGSY